MADSAPLDGEPILRRTVGRPRASGTAPDGSARDQIVAAATRLFAVHGYDQTSMTAIAEAAGLQQPSVYYWFRNKADVLKATLAVGRSSIELLEQIEAEPCSAAAKLYCLLLADTLELCLSPCDFNEVERAAEQRPDEFEEFWTGYQELRQRMAALVEEGIAEGQLHGDDPELAAVCLLALSEGTQKRYRAQHAHDLGPTRQRRREAIEYAEAVATLGVRSILRDPGELDAVRLEAAAVRSQPTS